MIEVLKRCFRKYQSLLVGVMLCMVGGSIDADSFLLHGHVFAGLQTGNLVILGAGFSYLTLTQILKYVFALLAFVFGITLTRFCQRDCSSPNLSKIVLCFELIILLTVCCLSHTLNSNVLIGLMSLVGAIQLQEFQTVFGQSFTSLMMMGHIKKVIDFTFDKNWQRFSANTLTLLGFILGAIVTGSLLRLLGDWSLSFAILVLFILLLLPNVDDCNH